MHRVLLLAFAAVFFAPLVSAQTVTGAITGTVTDPTGAVVPNVRIVASNTATNLTYSTTANEAGVYNLLFLPLGNYTISAEATGFKRAVLGPFALEVNQSARVDVRMEVGEVTQSVEIQGVAPILQTESTQTGDTVSGTQAASIPLNGRNFVSLVFLVPGAVTPNPNSISGAGRVFSGGRPYVNGNREQTNNFLLDGVDINEPIGNVVGYNPNVDALAEIKVITGNGSAEFGNSNGAIVNMALKSGTNQLHGNVFEFLRNDKLDANDFFSNRLGAKKRAFHRNVYGGTLGGPVVKNRAFFFLDYQGTRQADGGASTASVAPADFRTGDMSRYPRAILDPTTGNPFGGGIIPASRIVNPVAKALYGDPKLYPLPNNNGTGPIRVTGNYLSSSSNFASNDQADAKLDYRPSDRDSLSGRFTIDRYRDAPKSVALPIIIGTAVNAPTTGGVINWTRTFTPKLVNEARIGYTRVLITNNTFDPTGLLGKDGNAKLGIPGGQPVQGMSLVVFGDGLTNAGGVASDRAIVDNNYQYGDNLTYQHGRHLLKMGFQAIRYQQSDFYAGNNGLLGRFDYTGVYTNSAFADFLLNQLATKGRGSLTGLWGQRQWRLASFFQDDFKLQPNLTLNVGLRWEYTQPLLEVANRQTNVDIVTGQILFAGKDGNSRALYDSYHKQFMPRLGVAWTPAKLNNRFVVRAGYSITSFMEGTGANLRLPLNPPFFFESNVNYDLRSPGDIRTGFVDVQPQNTFSGQVRAWDKHLRPALTQQWNASGEYQFSSTLSLSVGYVGQRGRHLVDPKEFNQPLPGVGPVSTWLPLQQRRPLYRVLPLVTNISGTESTSTMDYNALQSSVRKRFSRGLEFIASYTLSNTLTDNLGYYGSGGVNAEGAYFQNAYDRVHDRGRAFFDARHIFSLGGSYDVPVGKGRPYGAALGPVGNAVLGGWTLHYLVSAHTGFPETIQSNDVTNQAVRGATRPNRYGALTYSGNTIDNWFGTGNTFCLQPGVNDGRCAYGIPAQGTFGNSAKGTEQAPHFRNFDTAVTKRFEITEAKYFEFRAELFNAFNHANFGPAASNISNQSTFGVITSTIGSPRNIEFALKFWF